MVFPINDFPMISDGFPELLGNPTWKSDQTTAVRTAAFGLAFLLGIGPTLGEGGRTATFHRAGLRKA